MGLGVHSSTNPGTSPLACLYLQVGRQSHSVCPIQVFLVGAPVQHILAGVSPDGTFVGSAVLCWTISVSTVGLIIFPKIWKVRQMHLKANEGETPAEAEPHPTVTPNADRSADAAATASTHSLASPTPVSSGPRIQMVTFD